ncbi:MAG TPA: ATP-binding protein [Caldilineaceae bacterium]|nr:ATP-binding protein [Caldilineaceae bacterium]
MAAKIHSPPGQYLFPATKSMTIRLQLTLWYTALLGATLILFSGVVYSALATNMRNQFRQETVRQALEISKAVTQQLQGNFFIVPDPTNLQIFPPRVKVDIFADNLPVQIIDLNGRILKKSELLEWSGRTVPDYQRALPAIRQNMVHSYYFAYDDKNTLALVASAPFKRNDQVLGAVQVIRSAKEVEETLVQVSRYLVLGTTLSLVLAAIVGAFLANRALRPIDAITKTASSITRTADLERRLNIEEGVSEVGQLAATFNEMLDRIQKLFNTQERLIADVSHELRTPLTTVQGNIELLQRFAANGGPAAFRNGQYQEALQETLREVENETTRMSRMINDLLLLAQADSGSLRLQLAPVEMDTLLLDVYRQTRRIAERRKMGKGWEIRLGSEDQALVWGDLERLRQLLLNLTDNAIKYTPEGGMITLSLENRQGWVKVTVSDNGVGIPPEQQEQIFERFYRVDKARSREVGGSGLGLSIVQWIAQAHHGRVTVESSPQGGSTFILWLPELQAKAISHTDNAQDQTRPVLAQGPF